MPGKSLKKTVLIIEDEPDLRQFASWVLGAEGYQVIQASDGEEGLELARQHHPDFVLLDISLPRRDGWSVLEVIKGTPALAAVPVVLFTASAATTHEDKALKMGASDYLVKPLSAEVLRTCVARIIPQD